MAKSSYLFYKPYDVLSQFTKEHDYHRTLADFITVEKDVYPVGRLDRDSEGLLLLSNDKVLINSILHPSKNKFKTYIVQLEGALEDHHISAMRKGIPLRINKKDFISKPAKVEILDANPGFEERTPPVRFRKTIPTTWVKISISEGKNRQVRKMFASINFPVLRLIRIAIGPFSLKDLKIGEIKEIKN